MAARKLKAALAHKRVIAVWHFYNVVVDFRALCGKDYFILACVGVSVGDVLSDSSGEQKDVLLHKADLLSQALKLYFFYVDSVKQNASACGFVKTRKQIANRRLSAAAFAYKREMLSGLDFQIDVFQDADVFVVGKAYVFKRNVSAGAQKFHRARIFFYRSVHPHDFQKALKARHAGSVLFHKENQLSDRSAKGSHKKIGRDQVGERHLSLHYKISAKRYDQDRKKRD